MKIRLIILASFAILVIFSQCNVDHDCIKGKGSIKTEIRTFDSTIRGIQFDLSGKLYVKPGNANEVRIEAQDNIIENIETRVASDNILEIDFDKCVKKYSSIVIIATIPHTEYLKISGAGDIYAYDTIYTNNLEMEIDGSGDIHMLAMPENSKNKTSLVSDIVGSGKIELRGMTDYHKISITGSGDIEAFELTTDTTDISIAGSGNCEVKVNKLLDVNITGSGNVYYKGNPEKQININGSGKVIDRN